MFRAADHEEPSQPGRRRTPLSKWMLLVAGSFALGGAVVLAVLMAIGRRDRMPELTPESLRAAQQRWEERGPASYDLDVTLSGSQSGEIHIEVRGGAASAMTRNGIVPVQRRTWDYWTVPGQFDTIADEIRMARDPAHGFPAPPGSQVRQRAEFDPQFGYPRRYHRLVLGTQLEIAWEVTRFEPIE